MTKLRWLTFLMAILIQGTGCKARKKPDSATKAIYNQSAWYVGARQPIHVCVNYSDPVKKALGGGNPSLTKEYLEWMTWYSFLTWIQYLDLKGIQSKAEFDGRGPPETSTIFESSLKRWSNIKDINIDSMYMDSYVNFAADILTTPTPEPIPLMFHHFTDLDIDRSFADSLLFENDCARADLEVHFGTKPTIQLSEPNNQNSTKLGSAVKGEKPSDGRRVKGAILLVDHGNQLSYDDVYEPLYVLTHEWGHVFGVPHIDGTIMDPQELAEFMATAKLLRHHSPLNNLIGNQRKGLLWNVAIDHWRMLAPCRRNTCIVQGLFLENIISHSVFSKNYKLDWFKIPHDRKDYWHSPLDSEKSKVVNFSKPIDFFKSEKLTNGNGDWNIPFFTHSKAIERTAFGDLHFTPEQDLPLKEIFIRDQIADSEKIYHGAYSASQWINSKFVVTTSVNSNQPKSPAIKVRVDCEGKSAVIFRSRNFGGNSSLVSLPWLERNSPLTQKLKDLSESCKFENQEIFNLDAFKVEKFEEKLVSDTASFKNPERYVLQNDAWLQKKQVDMTTIEGKNFCGQFINDLQVCLWFNATLAVLTLKNNQGQSNQCALDSVAAPEYAKGETYWNCQATLNRLLLGMALVVRPINESQNDVEFFATTEYGIQIPIFKTTLNKLR
jgi:hypothetical protein